jgi:2-hydroxy-3-oxopropionate reductase
MPDRPTVGFIGIGIMGGPMALNLLHAGYPLVVHNRTRAREEPLVSEGASSADSPRVLAAASDVVITMLPDSPDVEAVYFGEDGVLAGARCGQLLIDMSSIAPSVARSVSSAAHDLGADALDAPVSGGDVGARDGTLSIMVGGPEDAFDRARTTRTLGLPCAPRASSTCSCPPPRSSIRCCRRCSPPATAGSTTRRSSR